MKVLLRLGIFLCVPLALLIMLAGLIGQLTGGQMLAYASIDGDIYTYDLERGISFNLTRRIGRSTQPVWMPDGEQLLFRRLNRANSQLYIMDATGRNMQPFGDQSLYVSDPAPSPDGQWLAFASFLSQEITLDIFLYNLQDKSIRRLTASESYNVAPTWSPDSQTVAFASDRNGSYEVYQIDRSGLNLRPLTEHFNNNDQPAWSPDGTQIAFASDRSGVSSIYLMGRDGEPVTRLTDDSTSDTFPAWSSDGGRIVYVSHRAGVSSIMLINRDGSNPQLLIPNAAMPRWRPG